MQAPLLGIIDRPRDKSTKLEEEDIYIYINEIWRYFVSRYLVFLEIGG